MDKTSLVEPDIDEGKRLLGALERAGLAISIAGWFKLKDRTGWSLFVASPDVQKYGPRTVNKFIDSIRLAIDSNVSLDEITAINTSNHAINDIPLSYFSALRHKNRDMYRLRDVGFSDFEVEDGIVYKLDRSVKPSKEAPRPDAEALKRARKLAA